MIKPISYVFAVCAAIAQTLQAQGAGDDTHDHRLFPCMEDGLKSGDTGCQLLGKIMVHPPCSTIHGAHEWNGSGG